MAEGSTSPSLEDLMKQLGEKMDQDDFRSNGQGNIPITLDEGEFEIFAETSKGNSTNNSLSSFLNRVADKLDNEEMMRSNSPMQDQAAICSSRTDDTMEGLLTDLHKNLKSSDWLHHNTSEKWVAENPELSKAYVEAIEASKKPD